MRLYSLARPLVFRFDAERALALVELLAAREPNAELWLVVPPAEVEKSARLLSTTPLPRPRVASSLRGVLASRDRLGPATSSSSATPRTGS